jgi:hypothetical protein
MESEEESIHFLSILKELPALVNISAASSNFSVLPENDVQMEEFALLNLRSAFPSHSSPLLSPIFSQFVIVDKWNTRRKCDNHR